MATVMDGKALKAFVENDQTWSKFVDEKFAALDKNHSGTLTQGDMEPAIAGVGKALGLPPMGTDPETDHIYTEMFSEFGRGGEGVTKQTFSTVMRDILLGLGDGLEREPVIISPLDGTQLERWATSPEFEIEAVASFAQLDTDSSGQIKAGAIREALEKINVEQGMPPQADPSVAGHISKAFQTAGINPEQELNQSAFVEAFKKVVISVAQSMRHQPLTVAHTEKVFDGSSITSLLKDRQSLDLALGMAWEIMPKVSGGSAPKSYLRLGFDTLAPYAGLPPVGAVHEMDTTVNEAFKLIDDDATGRVDKPGFDKCMLEVLGGVMLQLEGKPIGVKSSAVVPPDRTGSIASGMPF